MKDVEEDEEMICGLTADECDVLRQGLRELPDSMPPRVVWQRIREQAAAEGLIRRPIAHRPSTWYAGVGMAATVLLAVIFLPKSIETPDRELRTEPPMTAQSNSVELTALQALMVQSQQLESDLRSLPAEPRVARASTVVTISGLENRIAAIDFQLNDAGVQMTAEEKELFWRERVRLMQSLVQLRYAQAQRTAF